MGRAIVRNPKAFLMDEPLSNLDAKLRVQMRTEVARIQSRLGTTTVYVTHDQTEAMTLGDRVAVMRSGVLQQVGAPAELYDNPKNLFVAGFIGSPAMNFMPASSSGDTVQTPMGDDPASGRGPRVGRGNASGTVIVGIRPESFEDASVVSRRGERSRDDLQDEDRARGVAGRGGVRLLPGRGSRSSPRSSTSLRRTPAPTRSRAQREGQVVARVAAASQIKRGQEAELWLDTTKLHFFDPSGGRSLAAQQD